MKKIEVKADVYHKLEARAKALGLTLPEYVESLVKISKEVTKHE